MEQEQQKHFLKRQSRQTIKRQRSCKTKALKTLKKNKRKKKIRKVQSLQKLLHNLFIKILLFGKRHYCEGFQINHNCFPL